MNPCDEIVVKTLRYLDNDLQGQELEEFRAHLESCADCRAHVESEKALSQTLHRSRPLYSAPAALRVRVSALAIQHSVPESHGILGKKLSDALDRILTWRILVPAAVVLALPPMADGHGSCAAGTDIAITDVRFGYKPNKPIFDGLTLSIPAGKVTRKRLKQNSNVEDLLRVLAIKCRYLGA